MGGGGDRLQRRSSALMGWQSFADREQTVGPLCLRCSQVIVPWGILAEFSEAEVWRCDGCGSDYPRDILLDADREAWEDYRKSLAHDDKGRTFAPFPMPAFSKEN
jgi:hypothetical protein